MDIFYQDFIGDGRQTPIEEIDPTSSEYIGASAKQTFELNPTTQLKRLGDLRDLEPRSTFLNEMGQEQVTPGLSPDDPRAQSLTLEQANEEGKSLGLRFSEPPTRGQFDYLAEMKRGEEQRALILSRSPGVGTTAMGFLADLAASAVDPINIASAFVPIVREGRYAKMLETFGKTGARALKGAAEGAVGTAMIEPMIYLQAQQLQQDFTLHDAFMDVVMGGILGGGLHVGAGKISDITERSRAAAAFARTIDETELPRAPLYPDITIIDRRSLKVPEGEVPALVGSMQPEERASLLNATVKSVESDNWPRVDELLRTLPEARSIALTDPKYPAITRLKSGLSAADFLEDTPSHEMINAHLFRTVKGADSPDMKVAFESLFKHFSKSSKKMEGWTIWTRTDEAYRLDAPQELLEHPDQKVYVDAEGKTIVASDAASLAAVRHEIERAMDIAQGYKGNDAGGYRYRRNDADGPVLHRKMLSQIYKQSPERAPVPDAKPKEAVDLFSRPEPIMKPNERASQEIWDSVEDRKDMDLDTIVKEEEIEAIEDTARQMQNSARLKGVIEKITPVEERDLFDVAAVAASAKQIANKAEQAVQEAVDKDLPDADLMNQVRAAFDADPDTIAKWMRGEITDEEFDAQIGRDLPPKTPEEGEEAPLGEGEDALIEALSKDVEAALAAKEAIGEDFSKKIQEVANTLEPADMADIEARVVAQEQQLLSGPAKTRDLFNAAEKEEFDEANRQRALRESVGADEAVRRASGGQQAASTALEDGLFATRTGGDGPAPGGKSADIDTARGAGGGDGGVTEATRSIGYGTVPSRVVTPDGSIEVGVEPIIVEWDSLRKAEGAFQPRDRTRKESDANIRERANRLDPEQLMPTRVSDSGPPIITKDGMVISGNGRYATIGEVYRHVTLEAQARRYRERLGPAADGYRQPILVMRITDDLSDEALVKFADRSNRGRIEQMSATEKAQRDVHAAGIDIMMLYQGGDFESRENRNFLQAFMRRVVTTSELGEISKNGRLTKEGYDRLNAAVLAAAYDDTGVLSLMLESADDNIRSITGAYRDVAPSFMKLRAEIAAGSVKEDMDLTPYMMEAARIISEQRNKGVKISAFLAQQDAFNPLDRTVETLIRAYYNKDLTRAASALRIGEYLTDFVAEARQHQTGGFLPDETTVSDVLAVAQRKREQGISSDEEQDPTGLLSPESSPRPSAPEVRAEAPKPTPPELGGEAVSKQPLTVRAAKLQSLVGDKPQFDAYVNKLGTLKKVNLEQTAESYLGRVLTAKERKTKQTVLDTLKATVKGEPGAAPAAAPQSSDFGKRVQEIANRLEDGDAASIAAIYDEYGRAYSDAGTLDQFKQRLLQANRDRSITMYRLDDPAAMEAGLRDRSRFETARGVYHTVAKTSEPVPEIKAAQAPEPAKEVAKVDPQKAQSLENAIRTRAARLAEIESDIRVKMNSLGMLSSERTQFDAMRQKIEGLRAGNFDSRKPLGKLLISDKKEQAYSEMRAKRIEGHMGFVERASNQLMEDYNRLARDANAIMDDIEMLSAQRDAALGLTNTAAAPALPVRPIDAVRRDILALDAVYLSRNEIQAWKAWREADTDLRSRVISGMDRAEVTKRFEEHATKGEEIIAAHNRARDESLQDAPAREAATEAKRAEPQKIPAQRMAQFYEYLKGAGPVKDIRTLARAMDIPAEMAGRMIDHGVDSGWLKMRDDGTVIRVPRGQRPSVPEFSAPAGWGEVEGTLPLDANERVIRETEMAALGHIAKAEGTNRKGVRDGWGYVRDRDYVDLARRQYGFQVDPRYDRIWMERDLQASLVGMKMMMETSRILPPVVQTQLHDVIGTSNGGLAYGSFEFLYGADMGSTKGIVRIAKSWDLNKSIETVHHETIHALRALRLFTKLEWELLEKLALRDGWIKKEWADRYVKIYLADARNISEGYGKPFNPTETQILNRLTEEAIARKYGDWVKARYPITEPHQMLFERIRAFLHNLFTKAVAYFKGPNAEEIFQAIHDGKIAERWSDWNGGRADANARNSIRSFSLKEQVDDLNGRMEELAMDDSEKIGSISARALEALVPCATFYA